MQSLKGPGLAVFLGCEVVQSLKGPDLALFLGCEVVFDLNAVALTFEMV